MSNADDLGIDAAKYVPSRMAYTIAAGALFVSSLSGGLIGYAMMKVFFTHSSSVVLTIGTCIICLGITYGVSVITSLGLRASVEWKARSVKGPEHRRPSRILREK